MQVQSSFLTVELMITTTEYIPYSVNYQNHNQLECPAIVRLLYWVTIGAGKDLAEETFRNFNVVDVVSVVYSTKEMVLVHSSTQFFHCKDRD